MAISPDQFSARHPYFLRVGTIGRALQKAIQSLLVIEDHEAGHEETVESGLNRPGTLTQGEAQAPARAAHQGYGKKRMDACGEF